MDCFFVVLKCRVCEFFRTFRFSRFLHVSFFKSSTFRFAGLIYVAKSRRNSLFFITDEGARRGAMFYSLTLSCMLNGVDAFEYFTDVIDKVAQMNPKSPIEKYRDLLPDKWTKQN